MTYLDEDRQPDFLVLGFLRSGKSLAGRQCIAHIICPCGRQHEGPSAQGELGMTQVLKRYAWAVISKSTRYWNTGYYSNSLIV